MPYPTFTAKENALKAKDWIKNRGGVAFWKSIDLSNAGATCYTPALTEDGKEYPKPHWRYANKPDEIITDESVLFFEVSKEVKRFKIHTRISGNGLMIKLTDHSSQRVRAQCEKFPNCSYHFDYDTQECVITVPDKLISLKDLSNE